MGQFIIKQVNKGKRKYIIYCRETIHLMTLGTFLNKRHAMHAEAMTFHKGSLIIFRTFVKKLGYIKVTDNFCAE